MKPKEILLAHIESIFDLTQTVVDGMVVGSRMQLREMAEAVALSMELDPKDVAYYVSAYAHHCEGGYVTRGKKGGFIKGVKVLKISPLPTILSESVD